MFRRKNQRNSTLVQFDLANNMDARFMLYCLKSANYNAKLKGDKTVEVLVQTHKAVNI